MGLHRHLEHHELPLSGGRSVCEEQRVCRMRCMHRLASVVVFLAAPTVLAQTPAASAPSLAGQWSASALAVAWSLEDWGEGCGTAPSSGREPGGTVTIEVRGRELSIVGLGRNYTTTQCWEHLPNMTVTSHGGGERAWRTVCRSTGDDRRRATLMTSLSATSDRIDFVESGTYELLIPGQTCRASVRRSRTFNLIQRAESAETITTTPSPTASVQEPAGAHSAIERAVAPLATVGAPSLPPSVAEPRCSTPGKPRRIEVHPSRKLLRSGERFSFRARVLDAEGCALAVTPTFKLLESTTPIEVSTAGVVTVPNSATEGEAKLAVTFEGRTVTVSVAVVSEALYRELLTQGTFNSTGELPSTEVTTLAGNAVGAGPLLAEQPDQRWRSLALAALLGLSIVFGVAGVWLVRRRRQPALPAPANLPPTSLPTPNRLVCPTCGGEFRPNQLFCPADGAALVPKPLSSSVPSAAPGASEHPAAPMDTPASRKICPLCGTHYPPESRFCGNDGAALVPVN